MGTVIQEAIILWCHWQPQDFYIHGIDTHKTVGCLSEHPWGICQTTWSSGCAVHTVCLFNKQPLYNIFPIYTSPFLVMQILFCGDSKLTMKMETAHSFDTRTIQSTSTHHHHHKTGSITPWDSHDSVQPFHLSNIQTLSTVVSEHVLHVHTYTHTSCTFWSCLITAICTVDITITNSSMWNA
jgi:hypothetical protein